MTGQCISLCRTFGSLMFSSNLSGILSSSSLSILLAYHIINESIPVCCSIIQPSISPICEAFPSSYNLLELERMIARSNFGFCSVKLGVFSLISLNFSPSYYNYINLSIQIYLILQSQRVCIKFTTNLK